MHINSIFLNLLKHKINRLTFAKPNLSLHCMDKTKIAVCFYSINAALSRYNARSMKINHYRFKPIANPHHNVHVIAIADRLKRGGQSVLQPHRTDFYIVQVISRGRASHIIDFEEVPVKQGDALFIAPGQVQAFVPTEGYDGWLLAFSKDFFCHTPEDTDFLDHAFLFNSLKVSVKLTLADSLLTFVSDLLDRIRDELNNPLDPLQQTILHDYLSLLIRHSERQYISEDPLQRTERLTGSTLLVQQFKKLVRENFKSHLKIKEYAAMLAVSERALQKNVESILGKTPKQFVQDHMLLESKRLLVHEKKSIKEISYELGFDEPSNFTIFFRGQLGLSPSEFKARALVATS